MEGKLVTTTVCYLVLVALLASVEGQVRRVSIRLHVANYTSKANDACIGGDVGLTDTLVLVHYRLFTIIFNGVIYYSDWIYVTKINAKEGFYGTLDLQPHIIFLGIQLRLLQLEHGGGSCNCWSVEEALVTWNSSMHTIKRDNIIEGANDQGQNCPTTQTLFCGGIASEARGFLYRITRLFSWATFIPRCLMNDRLIIRQGSLLSQNCSAANFTM